MPKRADGCGVRVRAPSSRARSSGASRSRTSTRVRRGVDGDGLSMAGGSPGRVADDGRDDLSFQLLAGL